MPQTYSDMDFDTDIAKFTERQLEAVWALDQHTTKFLLYGGAMGGGKSYWLRWASVRLLMKIYSVFGIKHAEGFLGCEDYPSLKDRQISKMSREFPAWLGRMYTDHKDFGRCFILNSRYGGGVLKLRNLDDPSKYMSTEFAFAAVDELTKDTLTMFNDLRNRLRWPGLHDLDCKFIAGTNPGGVGHGWVKAYFIDKIYPPEFYPPHNSYDYRTSFGFIKSLADDNPHLDTSYWNTLNTLPLNLRKAYRYGDWNTFVGQAFTEWNEQLHVIEPLPIPSSAPIFVTYDWGFGKPYSMGWWWADNDGRLYRFHEKYGWNGQPDTGKGQSDDIVAAVMVQEEERLHLDPRRIKYRYAGRDCFAKRPNPFGGGQGPATADVFARYGLTLIPGDPDRDLKLRQFHYRLNTPQDGSPPMVQIYNTCRQFIRTIPNLVTDEHNIEDINTDGEDHVYDEACHIFMARPMLPVGNFGKEKREDVDPRPMDNLQILAQQELQELREAIVAEQQVANEQLMESFGW
jgi:hypothetical protein